MITGALQDEGTSAQGSRSPDGAQCTWLEAMPSLLGAHPQASFTAPGSGGVLPVLSSLGAMCSMERELMGTLEGEREGSS